MNAKSYIMSEKLAKKEYVDRVDNKVDWIRVKKQTVVSNNGNTLHIVIPYDRMISDKGFINICGTLNNYPYSGIITYNKSSAKLHNLIDQGDGLYIIDSYPEENRLVRIMVFVRSYSVITLDSCDYFEQVII